MKNLFFTSMIETNPEKVVKVINLKISHKGFIYSKKRSNLWSSNVFLGSLELHNICPEA